MKDRPDLTTILLLATMPLSLGGFFCPWSGVVAGILGLSVSIDTAVGKRRARDLIFVAGWALILIMWITRIL